MYIFTYLIKDVYILCVKKLNTYKFFRTIKPSKELEELSKKYKFDIATYKIDCPEEQLRKPRIVKIGIFQHKIPLPTWSPIKEMRDAMFQMAAEALEVASKDVVNVFCFQEAWSKY